MSASQEVIEQQAAIDAEINARAKAMGHVDREHFKGDPKDWVDAKEFVRRGDESIPILKSQLEKTKGSLARLQKEHGELMRDSKQFKEMAYNQAKKEHEATIATLKEQLVAAREAGNHVEAVEIEEELATARTTAPAKPAAADTTTTAPPEVSPEIKQWFADNAWYAENPKLRARANAIGVAYTEQGMSGVELLESVKTEMEALFPEEFGGEPRSVGGARKRGSGAGGPGPGRSDAKTFDNLPQDAKDACNRLVRKGTCTKEEYLAAYQWD